MPAVVMRTGRVAQSNVEARLYVVQPIVCTVEPPICRGSDKMRHHTSRRRAESQECMPRERSASRCTRARQKRGVGRWHEQQAAVAGASQCTSPLSAPKKCLVTEASPRNRRPGVREQARRWGQAMARQRVGRGAAKGTSAAGRRRHAALNSGDRRGCVQR